MNRLAKLIFTESKLFLRDPMAVFFAVAFPPLLLAILGAIPAFREPNEDLGGARVIDLYVPIMVGFVLAMLAISVIPTYLATYRERGILRRLSTTPMQPASLLLAELVMALVMAVVAVTLVLAVGVVVFDTAVPEQPVGFLAAVVLGAGALLALSAARCEGVGAPLREGLRSGALRPPGRRDPAEPDPAGPDHQGPAGHRRAGGTRRGLAALHVQPAAAAVAAAHRRDGRLLRRDAGLGHRAHHALLVLRRVRGHRTDPAFLHLAHGAGLRRRGRHLGGDLHGARRPPGADRRSGLRLDLHHRPADRADRLLQLHGDEADAGGPAAPGAARAARGRLEENAGLHAQLLAQAREAGVLDERQRMAREIHDTLAQGLTGIITQLEATERAGRRPEQWRRHLDQARALARESLAEARRSVQALRPEPLEEAGLPDAIAHMARRWSETSVVEFSFATTGEPRPLLAELEMTLFRVAQEALANVAKHAAATKVGLTLSYMDDAVLLDVRDDGVGFTPVPAGGNGHTGDGQGFGLDAMR
jgi:signal transduction histidine kinase